MSAADYAARDAYRRSVRNGAATIECWCNLFGQIARENLAAREAIDFRRMAVAVENVLHEHTPDEAWLHGFSRALADLLCHVAIGEVPALLEHIDPLVPWDPLGESWPSTSGPSVDRLKIQPTSIAEAPGLNLQPGTVIQRLPPTMSETFRSLATPDAAQVESDSSESSAHRLQAYAPPTAPLPAPLTPAAPPARQERRQGAPQRLPRPVRQQDERALDAAARLREGFGSIPADSPLVMLDRAWRAQVPA